MRDYRDTPTHNDFAIVVFDGKDVCLGDTMKMLEAQNPGCKNWYWVVAPLGQSAEETLEHVQNHLRDQRQEGNAATALLFVDNYLQAVSALLTQRRMTHVLFRPTYRQASVFAMH